MKLFTDKDPYIVMDRITMVNKRRVGVAVILGPKIVVMVKDRRD